MAIKIYFTLKRAKFYFYLVNEKEKWKNNMYQQYMQIMIKSIKKTDFFYYVSI